MKRALISTSWLAALVLSGVISTGSAQTVYQNTINDLNQRFTVAPGVELGDEIGLDASVATLNRPHGFSFEYWATNSTGGGTTLAGTLTATLTLYNNNGALVSGNPSPNNVLWSGFVNLVGTERSVVHFDSTDLSTALSLPVGNITWSVKFNGSQYGSSDFAGLDVYAPATIGTAYPDYWQNAGTGWQILTNPLGNMSFGAQLDAVPEPATVWLLAFGGLLSFGLARSWRRKS